MNISEKHFSYKSKKYNLREKLDFSPISFSSVVCLNITKFFRRAHMSSVVSNWLFSSRMETLFLVCSVFPVILLVFVENYSIFSCCCKNVILNALLGIPTNFMGYEGIVSFFNCNLITNLFVGDFLLLFYWWLICCPLSIDWNRFKVDIFLSL